MPEDTSAVIEGEEKEIVLIEESEDEYYGDSSKQLRYTAEDHASRPSLTEDLKPQATQVTQDTDKSKTPKNPIMR